MKWLRLIWDETIGMFVDDGALAFQVALLIAAVAASVKALGLPPLLGGFGLLVGCVALLALSLLRKTRGR